MNTSFPRPRGVTIDVALPRWPLTLVKIGIGLLLLLAVIGALLAMVVQTTSSDSASSTEGSLSEITRSGDAYRVSARFERTGGGAIDLREWTLLLDNGSVVDGTVVSGPERLAGAGVADLVIEFPAGGNAAPAWVRLHQGEQPPVSFPVSLASTP